MSAERPIDLLLSKLEGVEKSGKRFMAFCKAHNDGARHNNRSLSIWEGDDGACAVNCFAGCTTEAIWKSVGLEVKDMWPRQDGEKPIPTKKRGPATKTHTYTYSDEDGRILFYVDRFKPKDPNERKYFQQRRVIDKETVLGISEGWYNVDDRFGRKVYRPHQGKGATDIGDRPFVTSKWFPECRRVLYLLSAVLRAKEAGEEIWFCEGEKDAHAVEKAGATATTCPGGASQWRPEFGETLRGCTVVIVRDEDKAGYVRVSKLYESLQVLGCFVRVVAPAAGKDAFDHLAAGHGLDEFVVVDPHSVFVAPVAEPTPAVALKVVDGGSEPPKKSASVKAEREPPKFFPNTDLGNAERLMAERGEDLRWCHKFGAWLVWDGTRFVQDETGGAPVLQIWRELVRKLYQDAYRLDPEKKKTVQSWARACEASDKVASMLKWAKALPGVPVTPDELDSDPDVFGVPNGVVDLRNGVLREARRSDLITKQGGIPYASDAEADEFEEWLLATALAGDVDLYEHIMHAIGYMLTGHVKEQSFFFAQGAGGGGKGTLAKFLVSAMGDYLSELRSESLMAKLVSDIPTDIAKLKGARVALVDETPQEKRFNESLLKTMTGGGRLTARFMRENEFTFMPNFKLMILGNNRPKFINFDKAIERRMKMWPFTNPIPNDKLDGNFTDRIVERNLAGFFALAVRYAKRWYDLCDEGKRLPTCQRVLDAVKVYQHESDSVGRFIEEECVVHESYKVEPKVLYNKFTSWAKGTGDYPISLVLFGNDLEQKGYERKKSNGTRYHYGLMLREVSETAPVGDVRYE